MLWINVKDLGAFPSGWVGEGLGLLSEAVNPECLSCRASVHKAESRLIKFLWKQRPCLTSDLAEVLLNGLVPLQTL